MTKHMTEELPDKDELIIRINSAEPGCARAHLIKALAASMRWAAHADKTDKDPENIVCLAQLIEDIVPDNCSTGSL